MRALSERARGLERRRRGRDAMGRRDARRRLVQHPAEPLSTGADLLGPLTRHPSHDEPVTIVGLALGTDPRVSRYLGRDTEVPIERRPERCGPSGCFERRYHDAHTARTLPRGQRR